jgi:hypothetical protein
VVGFGYLFSQNDSSNQEFFIRLLLIALMDWF